MPLKFTTGILLVIFAVLPCSCSNPGSLELKEPKSPQHVTTLGEDDIAVIEALLTQLDHNSHDWPGDYMVLLGRTASLCTESVRPWEPFCVEDNAIDRAALSSSPIGSFAKAVRSSFRERNATYAVLLNQLRPPQRIRIVDPQEVPSTSFSMGFWGQFYKKYNHSFGFAFVSLPVYNKDKTAALLFLNDACGGLCGATELIMFSRKGNTWTEIDKYVITMS